MKGKIKLAIADDNIIYRNILLTYFKYSSDFEVIIEVANGKELQTSFIKQLPDIVLLDLEMPVMNGFETTAYLSKHHPEIKKIILTMHQDEKISLDLIEKGANGFLSKDKGLDTILDAIATVAKHDYYYAGWNLKGIIASKRMKEITAVKSSVKFTERELTVIKLLCEEHTNKEIAEKLFVSKRTVEGYRDKILKKTNASNAVGLVLFAVQHSLITFTNGKIQGIKTAKKRSKK